MTITKLRPAFTFDQDRLDALRAIAPEAFADGQINWDALREALGGRVEDEGRDAEHFGLFWPGKRDARRLASMPSAGTLVPAPGEGVNEATTRHIFIEGDNLEVLKLLQKSYSGRVKIIYIDPPYNTGNDFIYSDNFTQPLEEYLRASGQADEMGRILVTNARSSGRYHSTWLNMMYPRLRLARNMLQEDGVIFVSIDDNEVEHLRILMNEVFGEENFLASVVVQSNKRGQTYKQISKTHEYLLIYTCSAETDINELEKAGDSDDLDLSDEIGRFNIRELRNRNPKFGRFNRPNLFYPIYVDCAVTDKDGFCPVSLERKSDSEYEVLPLDSRGRESCWRWGKNLVRTNIGATTSQSNVVARQKQSGEYGIYEKYRKTTYKAKSIWFENEVISEKGTVELGQLGLSEYFDFPKPAYLVKKVLQLATDSTAEDTVVDFFAGSCTTAQAVLELNREDGGNRRFLMVQLPEFAPNESSAQRAGFQTIADIGKERIRRVIQRMLAKDAGKLTTGRDTPEDLGFRVFKLDRSHYKAWRDFEGGEVADLQTLFDHFESPLAEGWKPEDVLGEVMLIEGFPLDSTTGTLPEFAHNTVIRVSSDLVAHRLYVCLDASVHDQTIADLRLSEEDIFICLDAALTDEAKVRLEDGRRVKVI